METLNIARAILADSTPLPPQQAWLEYIIAREGLYIRASNDLLEAMVLIAAADRDLPGLDALEERVLFLGTPKIPLPYLLSVLASARRNLPNEAMYQFRYAGAGWKVSMPKQFGTPSSLTFDDSPDTLLDLHSHGVLGAFFSDIDNRDEQGLRLYVVIGKVDSDEPEIVCRVGVFGHFLDLPADDLFEDTGPFVDKYMQHPAVTYEPIEEETSDDPVSLENEPSPHEMEYKTEMMEQPNI